MIPSATLSGHWREIRRWTMVGLAFLAQVGLLFWLGQRDLPEPVPSAPGPVLKVTSVNALEALALPDPTLFALPHPQGFSGPAWLSAPSQEIQPFAWTEPARFLGLRPEQLAPSFAGPALAGVLERSFLVAEFRPELLLPRMNDAPLFPDHSTVRLSGDLMTRTLKRPLELRSWESAEVLTNTVVQVLVDQEGVALSAILLGAGCGLKAADDFAVAQARAARFSPWPMAVTSSSPMSGLVWGELVFEWHTLRSSSSKTSP